MHEYHDPNDFKGDDYSDPSTSNSSSNQDSSGYSEPTLEEPVKYSMCAGCDTCGAYYNES